MNNSVCFRRGWTWHLIELYTWAAASLTSAGFTPSTPQAKDNRERRINLRKMRVSYDYTGWVDGWMSNCESKRSLGCV